MIKNLLLINKKKIIVHAILLLLLISGITWVFNDYYIYKDKTILKITNVTNEFDHENFSQDGESEKYYIQNITGKIMNGDYKGQIVTTQNEYNESVVFDDKYSKGDELFVALSQTEDKGFTCSIYDLKRDKYLAIVVAMLLWSMLLVSGKRGLFAIVSVIINIILLTVAFEFYLKGYNILTLFNFLVIIYTILCMLLNSGFTKKTLAAIISIIIALLITMAIFRIAYHYSGGVELFLMDYLINSKDMYEFFMAEILIGGLGAIMDVAISISSTINELLIKNRDISTKQLMSSGRQVGHDIMGTMISVLLFTFICGSFPMILLQIKNGYSIFNTISIHMKFEIYRFLIGSIGILLTVPISIAIAILILKKWGHTND